MHATRNAEYFEAIDYKASAIGQSDLLDDRYYSEEDSRNLDIILDIAPNIICSLGGIGLILYGGLDIKNHSVFALGLASSTFFLVRHFFKAFGEY